MYNYLKCGIRYEDRYDCHSHAHNLNNYKTKLEKNSDLKGIRTHDLCDTTEVLYQDIKPTQGAGHIVSL